YDEAPDGEADDVLRIAHQLLEAGDDTKRRQQRVLAPSSRGRAGMSVLAANFDDKTTRSLDSRDHADGLAFLLEPRSLLDMRLHECCGDETELACRYIGKGEPQSRQRVGHGHAFEILDRREVGNARRVGESRRTQATRLKSRA